MHIKDNLINFLYDKNYFISIYDNNIYVFNYEELITLKNDLVILKVLNFYVQINGQELRIKKMSKNEILVSGNVKKVGINYE
jgi:sporulation protein YqfC